MPTGYTANIEKMNFEEFTMNCARAFGALISMRDEPSDKEIPEKFEPSDYHAKRLEELKKDLDEKLKFNNSNWNELSFQSYSKEVDRHNEIIQERTDLREKYESMIKDVSKWEPPTKDHVKLKEFMTQQLSDSIKFDCSLDYLEEPRHVLTPEFKGQTLSKIRKDIAYHEKGYLEECQRIEKNNLWLKQLRDSLK